MLGDRDSEMGIVVWDDEDQLITMNGIAFRANVFSHNLRLKLWNEHCGLPLNDKSMSDPVSDATFKDILVATATKNTQIFNHVFPHIPQDSIRTYAAYDQLRKQRKTLFRDPEKLKDIRGRIQLYPLEFLADEKKETHPFMPEIMYH